VLTTALLAEGRVSTVAGIIDEATALIRDMDSAPLLEAGILSSRAQLAAYVGDRDDLAPAVLALLGVTTTNGFIPMTVEALELVNAATEAAPSDDPLAASLEDAVALARRRLTVAERPPTAADAHM
jgi:hypothetical protein